MPYKMIEDRRNSLRRWRKNNPDRQRAIGRRQRLSRKNFAYMLYWKFGLAWNDFEKLLIGQAGRCASCNDPLIYLTIDHNHKCCPTIPTCGDCIRGLLCQACNKAAGYLRDSIYRTKSLLTYLEKVND